MSDPEFSALQSFIHREIGIYLSPLKKGLLAARLSRRLRELQLGSYAEYYGRVVQERGDGLDERIQLFDAICTHETRFFREPDHFEYLQRTLLPRLRQAAAQGERPRRVRAWSAACSSGEEPCSLAMVLLEGLPREQGWEVEVLATDLSTAVLARAQEGLWPIDRSKQIPARYLKRFMLKGKGEYAGWMTLGRELRESIRYQRMNLNDPVYPVQGPFDLVFCRNVLIYFDRDGKQQVVERLARFLAPTGHLFLGHSESLTGLTQVVRSVQPTIYVPRPDGEGPG
jgi:chemotaxis protein methyltransferase CheR